MTEEVDGEMFTAFTSKRILLGIVERGLTQPLSHVTDDLNWLVSAYTGESFTFSDHLFGNPHQFDEVGFRTMETRRI